jgi:transcriptional regulator with XRE-family HTH domain
LKDKGPTPQYRGEILEWAPRLDQALKAARLTNVQLGAEMGVDNSTISRFRSGERKPSPDELAYLCMRAGVSADEILGIKPSSRGRLLDELEAQTRKAFEELRKR